MLFINGEIEQEEIIHLFFDHPCLNIHSSTEDKDGQKYGSKSELHISASQTEIISR